MTYSNFYIDKRIIGSEVEKDIKTILVKHNELIPYANDAIFLCKLLHKYKKEFAFGRFKKFTKFELSLY